MKRLYSILVIFILCFIVAACSQATDTIGDHKEKDIEIRDEKITEQPIEDNAKEDRNEPLYIIDEANWTVQPIDLKDENQNLLLTIDDAPDGYAVEMAKTLQKLNVPAIFFVNGHFLLSDDDKKNLKVIHDMGFVIGNHTYSHQSLPSLTEEEQKEEILKVNELVTEITGEKPVFFRAPFGQNTDYSKKLIYDEEMVMMNWTYGYDWNEEYMTKEALTDIMVNAPELTNGSNLLMHDREWTYEALEDIISGLENKGYEFIDPKYIKGYSD